MRKQDKSLIAKLRMRARSMTIEEHPISLPDNTPARAVRLQDVIDFIANGVAAKVETEFGKSAESAFDASQDNT